MSYNFLNFKLEDTIKNLIQSNDGPDCDVVTFGEIVARDSELAEPYIAIRCMGSTEGSSDTQLNYCGNDRYFIAEVAIRTHAADELDGTTVIRTARQVHGDLCGQVMDMFFQENIVTDLNNSAAVVQGIQISEIDQPIMDTGVIERSFVTSAKFRILCNSTL